MDKNLKELFLGGEGSEKMEAAKKEAEQIKKLQTFFKGLKFFLGREIPREPLVFMIRAFGGEASWDATVAPGSTYEIDDKSITHQICDRPRDTVDMKHVDRFYIQPQWVFDSINRRELLPVHKYFVGEALPPHLSPFVSEDRRVGDYIPPEEKEMLGLPFVDSCIWLTRRRRGNVGNPAKLTRPRGPYVTSRNALKGDIPLAV